MSGTATDWAMKVRGIRPGTKLILQLLCAHHNFKTGQCNPAIETLSESSDLARSTVLGHLAKLEAAGFIKRHTKALGRGRGKATQFALNMNVLDAIKAPENDNDSDDLQVQKPRRLESKTSSQPELEVQPAGPSLIEEPEKNRNNKVDFEVAWREYQACRVKVGQTKKQAKEQWAKSCRKDDPELILKAIKQIVAEKNSADGFTPNLPDMFRWLRDEKYNDVLREARKTEEKQRPHGLQDWKRWAQRWAWLGEWGCPDSQPPDHPDCKAPKDIIDWAIEEKKAQAA